MDNDSGALILLIVLIVSAFLLILIRLAKFVNDFGREKQYLLNEMHRAADYNEYRYWRRELRCLFLCLIPFVTERNVMRVYPVFFHRAKHAEKQKRSDGLMHILAPSMLAICICAICLCGVSWAWFTASTSTGTTQIQSSSYKLLYQVGEDAEPTELAETGSAYMLTADTCKITLKATGTAGATGYCSIKVGNETYYTEQIFANGTFTFTVNAAAGTTITLTPKWGTYSHDATLYNGDEITVTGSQQNSTQAPDSTVTTEPSAEPTAPTTPTTPTTPSSTPAESQTITPEPSATEPAAPTTPTTPTTPSSTPAESETTAPEPSATAPTEPKPTDTEPTPAPEDTTPENTTAAQTEPPTTEESENN